MALKEYGDFKKVDHGPRSQFEALLVKPWKESLAQRQENSEPFYVIPIDALDELDFPGGVEFLQTLIDIVKEHDLYGLKFLVTSRLEPALVEELESFEEKQVCRLEEITLEKTSADIKTHVQKALGGIATQEQLDQLVTDTAGLFIYAATVVEYLQGRSRNQQKKLLARILSLSHSSPLPGATARLDDLYSHILETSLVDPRDRMDNALRAQCLGILHTFLCTIERTSTGVAVGLLNGPNATEEPTFDAAEAEDLVRRLHAVLYVQRGQVLWFHKSFPDFIFSQDHSKTFYCDQGYYHRLLANNCFEVMQQELRFNIADISTSYQLDRDNPTLSDSIKTNISALLRYACSDWSSHLTQAPVASSEPFLGAVNDFLQLRFLFWIEAMNLLKCRERCVSMLQEVQQWVSESKVCLSSSVLDYANILDRSLQTFSMMIWTTQPRLHFISAPTAPQPPHLTSTSRPLPRFHAVQALLQDGGSGSVESLTSPTLTLPLVGVWCCP